jgi:hypothetical protein
MGKSVFAGDASDEAIHGYDHYHVNVHGIRRSAERDRAGVRECSAGFK